jgi:hypothetical protein
MSIYGPIITGRDVRLAMTETIRAYAPAYLGEVAAGSGESRGDLPPFRSYTSATEVDGWPEDQLPGCIVVAPGLLSTPQRDGNMYRAEWSVGVAMIVSGRDRSSTTDLVELYAAAVRSDAGSTQRQCCG